MKRKRFVPPEVCPICGEDVPRNALACPECGSDEKTGWSEAARYDGLDLPEEEFDYDKFAAEEFGTSKKADAKQSFWWVVAVLVLIAFLFLLFRGG